MGVRGIASGPLPARHEQPDRLRAAARSVHATHSSRAKRNPLRHLSLGIICQYVGRVFDEVMDRAFSFVDDALDGDEPSSDPVHEVAEERNRCAATTASAPSRTRVH